MKFYNKPSWWALIVGIFFVVLNTNAIITAVGNPIGIAKVDWVNHVYNFASLLFGAFLVSIFIKKKFLDDAGATETPVEEDESLKMRRQRAWIVSLYVLFTMLGSVDIWLLNDYTPLHSLGNIAIIWDVFICALLLYCIFLILRPPYASNQYIGFVFVAYPTIGGVFEFLQGNTFLAISSVTLAAYFAFAFYVPLTRKNHRLAHMVLLPIAIVATFIMGSVDERELSRLHAEETLKQSTFVSSTASLGNQYTSLLNREEIDVQDVVTLRSALDERIRVHKEYVDVIDALTMEYSEQYSSVSQQAVLLQYKYIKEQLALHQTQAEKLDELLDILESKSELTDSDQTRIGVLVAEIDTYNPPLAELDIKIVNLEDYVL